MSSLTIVETSVFITIAILTPTTVAYAIYRLLDASGGEISILGIIKITIPKR